MKTCPKCDEKITNDTSKYCPNCGIELKMNPSNLKSKDDGKLRNDAVDKLVDSTTNTINQVVTQVKIEKNYIKYRLEDNEKTQLKGDEFIISEKIANTIDNLNNEKREKTKKTEIKIEDNEMEK